MTEIIPTAEFNQLTILEILQRFWKPINLGTLGMTGHGCVNWYHQLVGKFHVYLHTKNQIYPSPLSWSIAKILQTLGYCYFRCFCTTGYDYQKRWYQLSGNFDVYLPPNNQIYPLSLSWNIAKTSQTCHFEYFGNVRARRAIAAQVCDDELCQFLLKQNGYLLCAWRQPEHLNLHNCYFCVMLQKQILVGRSKNFHLKVRLQSVYQFKSNDNRKH